MKDFINFMNYCKKDEYVSDILSEAIAQKPDNVKLSNDDLAYAQKMATKTVLAYLQAYHEWLSQNQK